MDKFSSLTLVVLLAGAGSIGCDKKPGAAPSENGPFASGSDLERLEGVWAVESWDAGSDVKNSLPEDEFEKLRYQFQGNNLSALVFEKWQSATFKLDEKANPRVMIVTHLDDKGEPMKQIGKDGKLTTEPWTTEDIYKFEGDLLVIAHSDGVDPPRPTEFKTRAAKLKAGTTEMEVYPVDIIKLKKTSEPIKDREPPKNPGITPPSRPGTAK